VKEKKTIWDFDLSSVEQLKKLARSLGVKIETTEDISVLAKPVPVGSLVAPNCFATQAMEGCDGDTEGRPSDLTIRRYERFAAGGAGVIWSEAIAAAPEGKANPRQLWLNDKSKDLFAKMLKRARSRTAEVFGPDHRPIIVAQLTHSGRYSKPTGLPEPMIPQHDPYRDVMVPQNPPDKKAKKKLPADYPVLTDEYLDNLQDAYIKAAKMAFEVGFDAVDVKSCHGYLINELFACYKRKGKYGGSFENRTRMLWECVDKIHDTLGSDKMVTARLGLYDAIPYPYGWAVDKNDYRKPDLTEPKKLVAMLVERGVKILNTTIANPYYNPHIGRPFNEAIIGAYPPPEHPLIGVHRILTITGQIQKAFPDMAVVATGYSWLRALLPYVAAAYKNKGMVTFIGAGRMSFAYPDFPKDIITKGKMDREKTCIGCSACTQIMRDAGTTGCVLRDNEVYGPIFDYGRTSDRDNLARLADACRECGDATCQQACPAGVQIPKFIKEFLNGDDRAAYQVIRKANVLPDICAWLCPIQQFCEGKCLQSFIGDGPVPVSHIQQFLAKKANNNGWSKLRVPEKPSGKTVAVIGAGPAGLACTVGLLEKGHSVTVLDRNHQLGGIIESVIAPEKYGTSLEAEVRPIFDNVGKERLTLQGGKTLNADFNLDGLISGGGYDSVFIAMGLVESKTLHHNGPAAGLWNALDFLAKAKQGADLQLAGKTVAVIGGGNTGMDVAGVAKKRGAAIVYVICFESFLTMPAWLNERRNALAKDIHFMNLFMPKGYVVENGNVRAVKLKHVRLAEPDDTGFRAPVEIDNTEFELKADIIVEALGQKAPAHLRDILPAVELTGRNLVAVKTGSHATSRKGVFAGGDIINGGLTVVAAVADGMAAAEEIDEFLKQT